MFVRTRKREAFEGHEPGFTVIAAPPFRAAPDQDGTRSEVFVVVNFERREILIGGTACAGEIKKSVFPVMNGFMPERDVLSMHCAANHAADPSRPSACCIPAMRSPAGAWKGPCRALAVPCRRQSAPKRGNRLPRPPSSRSTKAKSIPSGSRSPSGRSPARRRASGVSTPAIPTCVTAKGDPMEGCRGAAFGPRRTRAGVRSCSSPDCSSPDCARPASFPGHHRRPEGHTGPGR